MTAPTTDTLTALAFDTLKGMGNIQASQPDASLIPEWGNNWRYLIPKIGSKKLYAIGL